MHPREVFRPVIGCAKVQQSETVHVVLEVQPRDALPVGLSAGWLAVSTDRLRYVEYADPRRPPELYDIQADPREWTNLAGQAEHAETLAKMRKLAAKHQAKFWRQQFQHPRQGVPP